MLVFIDESGCSGFKLTRGADAVFAIGMVVFESAADAARTQECIARLRRVVSHDSEFKFSKSSSRLRDAFFRAISDCPFKLRVLVLDRLRTTELPEGFRGERFHRFFLGELLRRWMARGLRWMETAIESSNSASRRNYGARLIKELLA